MQSILNAWRVRFICLLFLGLVPPLAHSATVTWVGGTGNWNTATNWSTSALPGTNDDVVIGAGPAITVTHSSGTHAVKSVQSQQAFTLSGGMLTVSTTFQASHTFTLSGGGALRAATVVTTNGASLIVSGSGTLDGVTVNGVLDVGNTYSRSVLTVTNGLMLNGTALVGNPTNSNYGYISFAGTQSLSGNGTVVFGNYTAWNALQVANGGTTLTIGVGIIVRGKNGQIGYNSSAGGPTDVAVINQGTISADVSGGTIAINAQPLTNQGLVQSPEGTLRPGLWDNTGQTMVVGTSLNLKGGTIRGGTITLINGVALIVNGSLTLDRVTVNGVLDVGNSVNGAVLTVTNGLVLNGTALLGNPTNNNHGYVSFAGTQSLSGNGTVAFGFYPSWNVLQVANGGTTLTIGAGIIVHGKNGQIGYSSSVGGSTNVAVINQGTISADVSGGTITINAQPLTNQGLVQGANGGVLNLEGSSTWTALATMSLAGGTVYLKGSLSNNNTTVTLDGTNGTCVLQGGTVYGGTIVTTNGASLVVKGNGTLNGVTVNGASLIVNGSGTLNGVTVNGVLDVGKSVNGSLLTVTNGLVLNGTAYVGHPTNNNYGAISFAGSQTLSGNGTVVIGYKTGAYNALQVANADTTLTIGSGITVRGKNGQIGYAPIPWGGPANVAIINQGTISADVSGGTINLNGQPFVNQGVLNGLGGSFNLGLLDNSGQTIVAGTNVGALKIVAATIRGGSIIATNEVPFVVNGSLTLDGVTVNGVLDVGNSVNGAVLTVTNGLVLNGTAYVGHPTNNNYGAISFAGSQTMNGNGTVLFGASTRSIGGYYYNTLRVVNAATTLTLGPRVTVCGKNGTVGYHPGLGGASNVAVNNQGTISADGSGGAISINAQPFTNQGLAQAIDGGTLTLNSTWSNSGTLGASNGMVYCGGSFSLADWGRVIGTNATFYLSGTLNNTNTTLTLDGASGPWRLQAGTTPLRLQGGTIRGGTILTTNGAWLIVNGSGMLDGVAINGMLDVGNENNSGSGAVLTVTNGLVLNGTALVGHLTQLWYGKIRFAGSQTLSGNGTVVFGENNVYNSLEVANGGTTLTIGSGITVHGKNGVIGYNSFSYPESPANVAVINKGTISADVSGGTIVISAQPLSNQGNLQSIGGVIDVNCPVQIDTAGRLTSHGSDVFAFGGNLLGTTRNAALFDPLGTVQLDGASKAATAQLFEVMSQDLGDVAEGFNNNFAYGTIRLANNTYVKLIDLSYNSNGTNAESLYVSLLVVPSGCTLDLNGLHVYARLTQISGTVTEGSITQVPDSGPIAYGANVPGSISIAGESNEWTFFGRAGRSVTIVVNPGGTAPAAFPPYLDYAKVILLNPTNGVIAVATNTTSGQVFALTDVRLPMDGVYHVQVRASPQQSASTGNYLITVWDVTADVATLVLNRQCNGSIETPYSVDRWTFSAVAGQQVRFNLLNSSSAAIAFDFRGPANWGGFTNLTTSSDLITLPASGAYTLTAHGTGGQYGGTYAFIMDETTVTDVSPGSSTRGQLVGSGQAQLLKVLVNQPSPMMFSLSFGSSSARVEMYLKYGSPPTRSVYDQRYEGAASQMESILVALATPGDWYVLIYGDYVPSITEYSLQITAQAVFIQTVAPNKFGSSLDGMLTITGAGFDSSAAVRLVPLTASPIQITNITVKSGTVITAVLPSNSIPAGTYDICVSTGEGSACVTNALTMVLGGLPDFQVRLTTPNVVGYHQLATIYVEYANNGTAGMPAPLLTVTAAQNGVHRAFLTFDRTRLTTGLRTAGDQAGFSHSVQILASGSAGGWLQPGESCRVPVYYAGWEQPWEFSYPKIVFSVNTRTADSTDIIDWTSYATNSRPSGITAGQWTKLLQQIETRFGNTWGSYVAELENATSLVPPFTCNAYDAGLLFGVLVEQLTGMGNSGILGKVVDLSTNQLVRNVAVVARQKLSTEDAIIRNAQTDSSGQFAFTNLPPGAYELAVEGYYSTTKYSYLLTNNQFLSGVELYMIPIPTNTTTSTVAIHTNESNPSFAIASGGIPHIVWNRGSEIWHAYHDGTNWISTGALPSASGVEPTVIACSNLVDGVSAGLLVAWQTPATNSSSLSYAVGTGAIPGGWKISSPLLLNETNTLLNQGLALATQPGGQVLAVWQKSSWVSNDDTDLYYRMIRVQSNSLTWTTGAVVQAKVSAAATKQAFGETCASLDLDFGKFEVPSWMPILGGTYKFSADGELCGAWDCNPSFSLTGGKAQVEFPFCSASGSVGGSAAWRVDPIKCRYEFNSAEVTYSIDFERTFSLPRVKLGKLPIYAQFGSTWTGSASGSIGWEGVNFPSWPNKDTATFSLQASLFGQARGFIPAIGTVSGTATAEAKLSAEMNMFGGWKPSVTVVSAFKGQAGPVKINWKVKDTFPDSKSKLRSLSTDVSGLTIAVSPLLGRTNVYEGNPVLADVMSNRFSEGIPHMASTIAGNSILAWIMDSQNPDVELGSRVLVATWQNAGYWSVPVEVPHSMGFNSDVKVSLDSLDHPFLVWAMASSASVGLTNNALEIVAAMNSNKVVFSRFGGSSWSEPAELATTPGYNRSIKLGHDAQRHLWAAWISDQENCSFIHAAWWNGSAWSAPSLIATGAIPGDLAISVVGGAATLLWTQDFGDTNSAALSIVSSSLDTATGQWSTGQVFSALATRASTSLAKIQSVAAKASLITFPTPPSSCCDNSNPTNQPPPPTPSGTNDPGQIVQPVGSTDPNGKIWPSGYGTAAYVSIASDLPYTIEFENATNATAPAQQVNILDPLDAKLDWDTFELLEVGFGNHRITIPAHRQYFETSIPMTNNGVAFEVDIYAGIDLATGEIYADFYSIDPLTSLPPDVMSGFLPPEDGTGRGQGHISFTIRAKTNLVTGTVIRNVAYITFDNQEIISTDQIDPHDVSKGFDLTKGINTIDAEPPSSSVNGLPTIASNRFFTVSWSGTDVGSGIGSYDIYVSTSGGPWTLWLGSTTNTSAVFTGQFGRAYGFCSIARDGVGNVEALHGRPDTLTTTPNQPSFKILAVTCLQENRIHFVWESIPGKRYTVMTSSSLQKPDWKVASTQLADSSQTSFEESQSAREKYYVIREEP